MKNVNKNNLKTCIFKTIEEFASDAKQIYGKDACVDTQFDGLTVSVGDVDISEDDLVAKLSEFYEVNVTSFHIDQCDWFWAGIWIVYKKEREK